MYNYYYTYIYIYIYYSTTHVHVVLHKLYPAIGNPLFFGLCYDN